MRIKLLYPPRAHGAHAGGPPGPPPLSRVPLIGLPILKAILETHGFRTDIDDLDILVHCSKKARKRGIDIELFLDKERVKQYIAGENDDTIEEQISFLLKLTKTRGYDIFGFSITDEWNFSTQATTLLLSKALMEKTGALTILGGGAICSIRKNFSNEEIVSCADMVSFESPPSAPWRLVDLAYSLSDKNRMPSHPLKKRETMINNYAYEMPTVLLGKRLEDFRSHLSCHPQHEFAPNILDYIMMPDFRGLPLKHYVTLPQDIRENFGVKRGILVLPYSFAIGCPFECAFCGCSADSGQRSFHIKRPETIAEELALLSKRHRTHYFQLMNTNINPTKSFARRLIKELKERDLDLMLSDCANLRELDDKLLQELYDVGVRRLIYGLESPNDKMLRYIDKGTTLAHAKRILTKADEIGIWNEAEIICGMPFETPEIEEQTISFMKEFHRVINYHWVHKYKLLHSKMLLLPKKYGLTNIRKPLEPDVQGWAFDEVGGLPWAEKYKQIQRSYQRVFELAESFKREAGYSSRDEGFIRMYMLYSLLGKKKDVVQYMQTQLGKRSRD